MINDTSTFLAERNLRAHDETSISDQERDPARNRPCLVHRPQPTCSDANLEPPDVDRKGSWAMQSRRFSGLPLIGILAVIYFIAGKLGLMLASLHASASPVWPPAGIALAALLLLGYRAWPATFIGAFLVNVTTAGKVATSFAIATGNTLEAVLGGRLVHRISGGPKVFDPSQGGF